MTKKTSVFTPFDIVFLCVLSATLGVAYWGWTFVYEVAKPFLNVFGLKYLTAGFWIFAAVFLPAIIKRPGVAILASVIAAFIESLLTKWGLVAVLWGLVQGLGAELIFAIFRYKYWNRSSIFLATVSATTASYLLDYFYYDYQSLGFGINAVQFISFQASSVVLAFGLTLAIIPQLKNAGLLEQYDLEI